MAVRVRVRVRVVMRVWVMRVWVMRVYSFETYTVFLKKQTTFRGHVSQALQI